MYRRSTVVTIVALAFWTTFQATMLIALPSSKTGVGRWQTNAAAWPVLAQGDDPRADDQAADDMVGLSTVVTGTTEITATELVSVTGANTDTDSPNQPSQSVQTLETVTGTTGIKVSAPISASDSVTVTQPISDPVDTSNGEDDLPLSGTTEEQDGSSLLGAVGGTILANRTLSTARFFVEGQTYTLPSLRSIGLELPRNSAVLNLFNCDAAISEDEESCFWDSYMIDRDGFYEVITGLDVGRAVNLLLQDVGAPEGADIWIQNRSSEPEVVVYRNQVYDLQPGAIREFSVGEDALPTFFLRSCVEIDGVSVCEWAPVVADPGVYYLLREVETVGGLPNSRVTMLELVAVSGNAGESQETPLATKQILCNLLVPALNVRSGPGLEYQIVAKIRGTETAPASVLIVGRNATAEWLAVDERVAVGGWITGSASYVICDKAISELDEVEITDGQLAPTPVPAPQPQVVDVPPETPSEGEPSLAEQPAAEPTSTPAVEIPEGQSLLVVNNGFDHDIRFTLDQRYRVQPGLSEFDLKPGDTINLLVYPGMIGFSASTPWRGISGNDDFFIEQNESRTMWLIFMPDPDGSGRWILQY